jgi:hypothetical protein
MKALRCREVSLRGLVFDTLYGLQYLHFLIFEMDPPLSSRHHLLVNCVLLLPQRPVYNSTIQKANKVSPEGQRPTAG